MRALLLTGAVISVTLGCPSPARGQSGLIDRLEVSATLGATPNQPRAFADCNSPIAGRLGARLALRVAPAWRVDFRNQGEFGVDSSICFRCEACAYCSFDRCLQPPVVGPYAIRDGHYESPIRGSIFMATGLGIERTILGGKLAQLRVHAGASRIWIKRLWVPELSTALHFGRGLLRGVVEISLWHYTLPRTDVTTSLLNGQAVGSKTEQVRVHENTFYLDVGFTLHPSLDLGIR